MNYYNDPFYPESSFALRSSEESGDYDFPALPAGGGSTSPSTQNMALPGLGGGPLASTSGGRGAEFWDKAPEIIGILGNVIGTVKSARDAKGPRGVNEIKAACGRKPLIGKAKKQAYAQCVQRVLNPVQTFNTQREKSNDEGMSTTTKVIIGVVVLVVLVVITVLIVKLSKKSA